MFASRAARPKAAAAPSASGERPTSVSSPATRSLGCETPASGRDFARVPPGAPPPARAALPTTPTIGRTDDPLEREADRLADQVMGAPDGGASAVRPLASRGDGDVIRRTPASGGDAGPTRDLLSGPGQGLDAPTRAFFEPRFGLNLSQVRVHADGRAARAATTIGAKAFAAGSHIGFAANQYAPASPSGRRLLAHELAHVAQSANAPGAQAVVRRTPADPVMYDSTAATFGPPAASDTLASVKADISAKQAKTPDPDLGPTVNVKGVTAGAPEELYVWNVLRLRGDRAKWGTAIQVVTAIGPKPPDPPGGAAPVGQITITLDSKGNATAELIDRGPVAVPAAYPDKDKAVTALKTDFGFVSVDDGTAAWTPGELNKVYAALSLLPPADRKVLTGAALVRDSTLTDPAGKPRDAAFRHASTATPGSAGTPSVASRDESLHVANAAFSSDAKGFIGETGKTVLPSLGVILHEAGHAAESKVLRDAQFDTVTARATQNNDTLALAAEDASLTPAVDAANTAAAAAFAAGASYGRGVATGARPFAEAFNAAITAISNYSTNTAGAKFVALEAAAAKAIAARDTALGKLPAGHPARTDFASAISTQDAWFAQAQARAKASLKLDASKTDLETKTAAETKASDTTGKMSKRLGKFVALVNASGIKPLTQYAKDSWPAIPDEFFAEVYALWRTNPGYLTDNAPKLKAWFDSGGYLK